MYKHVNLHSSLVYGLSLVFLASCGGGSGGGSTSEDVIDSTLNTASVETIAGRIALEGDCNAVAGVADLRQQTTAEANPDEIAQRTQPSYANRISSYTSTISGLLGGTLKKTGDHNNGTDTLTYTYQDFTNPVGRLKFAANGSASVIYHGKPGDFGPIVSNKTVDTNAPISIKKSAYSVAGRSKLAHKSSANYEFSVKGLNRIFATVLFDPDNIVIDSATVKNLDTGQVYKISNLKSKGYIDTEQLALSDLSYTYTSSDVGTLKVTSDSLIINLDSMKIPKSLSGTLAMTATDGTKPKQSSTILVL